MITLTILNETGHTTLTLSESEVIEQIDTHPTHWVFINGEMVAREQISPFFFVVDYYGFKIFHIRRSPNNDDAN